MDKSELDGWPYITPLALYMNRPSFGAFIQADIIAELFMRYDNNYHDKLQDYLELANDEGFIVVESDDVVRRREFPSNESAQTNDGKNAKQA